jgi:hypothetical protein
MLSRVFMEGESAVKSNYRNQFISILCLTLLAVVLPPNGNVWAQAKPQSEAPGQNRLAPLLKFEDKFGPSFTNRLSSGGATMFHMAKVLSNPAMMHGASTPQGKLALEKALSRTHAKGLTIQQFVAEEAEAGHTSSAVPINDADLDYQFTRFSGFTQSETSSAWCGDSVVAGFNDSGAFVRSIVENVGGVSISGVGVSQNRGRSFTGLPFLNPGPDPATFLGGDPVVVCSDSRHFAYSSLLSITRLDSQGNLLQALTGISISRSASSGLVWDNPIPAVTKDLVDSFGFPLHFLDKEWMAIDPHNPNNLYITYTDFGGFGSDATCNDQIVPGSGVGGPDVHIELVASKDGGDTWSAPVVLDRQCNLMLEENLSGSQVVVGPKGEVYVAYTHFNQKNAEMRIRSSQDGGATFAPTVVVAEATTASSLGFASLAGDFRTNPFPTLAVDSFGGANLGALYMAWTDATLNQVPDVVANLIFGDPVYSFGDIVFSISRDGGNTWSAPKLVSPTPASFKGAGRDQFMPGVAVDAQGHLAVCYSDRRNDPNNLAIDHFCSLSTDQGHNFKDVRETPFSWAPGHLEDVFINPAYMGDYDAVSVDATGANAGFFSTFQIQTNTNPDVFGTRLKP